MRRWLACLALSQGLAAPAMAQETDAERQARVDLAGRIGAEINAHDQSAWHVTDALMAVAPPEISRLPVGYVTERLDAEHVKTTFILTEGESSFVYFTGIVRGSRVTATEDFSSAPQRPPATPQQVERLAATREIRTSYAKGLCGQRPNIIAFPSLEKAGATDFYVLVPETKADVVQFGGHERVRINADGSRETRIYSNTCIALSTAEGKDAKEKFLYITVPPSISDIPTEIHFFKATSHNTRVFVGAGGTVWDISSDGIKTMDISPPAPN